MITGNTKYAGNSIPEIARLVAAELREHPENWTQGYAARTASGKVSTTHSSDASCWCMLGFVLREIPISGEQDKLETALTQAIPNGLGIVGFNDREGRTPAEVADVFDKAAEILEAQS